MPVQLLAPPVISQEVGSSQVSEAGSPGRGMVLKRQAMSPVLAL